MGVKDGLSCFLALNICHDFLRKAVKFARYCFPAAAVIAINTLKLYEACVLTKSVKLY